MRTRAEWVLRNLAWIVRGEGTVLDSHFVPPVPTTARVRPAIGGGVVDDWQLQDLVMCPAGGQLRATIATAAFVIQASHPSLFEPGYGNEAELRQDTAGNFYLWVNWVMFDPAAPSGIGCCAFFRAAQAAQRLGLARVELLAAGGNVSSWSRPFNGYYSWPRFGFDAPLEPVMLATVQTVPHLSHCRSVQDVMTTDSAWWKSHGDGCVMTFDLAQGSPSWHSLGAYMLGRKLVV